MLLGYTVRYYWKRVENAFGRCLPAYVVLNKMYVSAMKFTGICRQKCSRCYLSPSKLLDTVLSYKVTNSWRICNNPNINLLHGLTVTAYCSPFMSYLSCVLLFVTSLGSSEPWLEISVYKCRGTRYYTINILDV